MKNHADPSDRRWPHLKGDLAATLGLLGLMTLLCVATLLASCRWSVPADPGLNARVRGDRDPDRFIDVSMPAEDFERASADDPGAATLYHEHCGRCHEAWHPTYLTAREWPRFVRKYAPRAGLFGTDRERVQRWLMANAR